MKHIIKSSSIAIAVSAAALFGTSAYAQVAGIATSSPEAVIVQSKARIAAYEAINTTYAAQLAQVKTLSAEINTLNASMDANGDRQVDQKEYDANPKIVASAEEKQRAIDVALQPLRVAQVYVIDQLSQKYDAARMQVINQKKIQLMLNPDSFQYAPEGVDVTKDILAAFNTLVPSVSSVVPAGYQPSQEAVGNYQQIQQLLGAIMQRQAAQAAQASQAAQQQAAKPATAPKGR